jgi:hypothetical protein
VVDCGGLTVGLRRGDGEREREREGKIWGENGLGKKNGYRRRGWVFKKKIFFFFFKKKKQRKRETMKLQKVIHSHV